MPTTTTTDVTMPQLGESVTEGTIGAWLRAIGDTIEKYDPLVEVESDKASSELPAPVAGVLAEILVEPGTTVPVGTTLCRIEEAGSAPLAAPVERTPELPATPRAAPIADARKRGEIADEMTLLRARSSPFVRRTAEEFGLDIAEITGSGVGGRVTKRDVMTHVAALSGQPAPAASVEPSTHLTPAPAMEPAQAALNDGDEVVPVTAMRRSIAANMLRSVQTAPHASVVMEVDMSRVVAWREAAKEAFRQREGVDLTYLPIVLEAVTAALREHPRLNAVWDETRIIHRRAINLGVAVALEDGLVVPVIRNADRLNRAGLAHALAELTAKARAGTLAPDDFANGTFTVNNPGTFGSLVSTPILVPPQVGILSTEAIIKRPVVVDDMIGIRSMMNLSLTIDHRALDGLAATRFLRAVKSRLEAFSGE